MRTGCLTTHSKRKMKRCVFILPCLILLKYRGDLNHGMTWGVSPTTACSHVPRGCQGHFTMVWVSDNMLFALSIKLYSSVRAISSEGSLPSVLSLTVYIMAYYCSSLDITFTSVRFRDVRRIFNFLRALSTHPFDLLSCFLFKSQTIWADIQSSILPER